MSKSEDYDSDAPEEFTAEQGIELDAEIRKIQKENKSRIAREGKALRRKWAERKTPRPSKKGDEGVQDTVETEDGDEEDGSLTAKGMLPSDIVQQLAAREKYCSLLSLFPSICLGTGFQLLTRGCQPCLCRKVFFTESDDEDGNAKLPPRKKKARGSGPQTVILNEISPPPCLQNSLEFLKKNKMRLSRSSAVLNNSSQALRFISTSGLLSKK
ncbi:unnamed protein product [Linum tenue]|uniref:Uncharacterized protein n=1 Tax=Linum tenue TaxID=586396 RepID=A0AAV0RA06_9ROSI|nr:unnamed protein product [Linum tenue]